MEEQEFLRLLDQADRELDSFPFWASFKKACSQYPVKAVKSITPGRQALLILWEANSQTRNEKGEIISLSLEGEKMQDKLQRLKEDLIGHFMNEELDSRAVKKFVKSVVDRVSPR